MCFNVAHEARGRHQAAYNELNLNIVYQSLTSKHAEDPTDAKDSSTNTEM